MYKLIITAQWPVYYHIPIYKNVAKISNLDIEVIYFDDIGIRPMKEKEFGNIERKWDDIDLLSGYRSKFLNNLIRHNNDKGFFNLINPGIIKYLYVNRPDVVMIQSYSLMSYWLAFVTAKILKIPIIFRGEATLRDDNNKNFKNKFKDKILKWWLKNCDIVLYSCTGNKEYWKYYNVDEYKMLPIPCAVDNEFFQNEKIKYFGKEKEIKKELDIDENDFVIIFAARFTNRKRPFDLLNAVKKVDNKNIVILFVGDGIEKYNMEKFARENNIKVVFTGFKNQSEISKYYSIADLYTVISDYDPSPKALNEAMNFELPIIVTDIVGTAYDLVKDGQNGYIIKVGDIDILAQKIDYLNKKREIAKQMGKKSLAIVNEWTFEKDAYYINKSIKRIMSNED